MDTGLLSASPSTGVPRQVMAIALCQRRARKGRHDHKENALRTPQELTGYIGLREVKSGIDRLANRRSEEQNPGDLRGAFNGEFHRY